MKEAREAWRKRGRGGLTYAGIRISKSEDLDGRSARLLFLGKVSNVLSLDTKWPKQVHSIGQMLFLSPSYCHCSEFNFS